MNWVEIIGYVAIYLVVYVGGGYLATLAFALWLNTTKWARTAELAFFGPIIFFGATWAIVGGVIGLILLIVMFTSPRPLPDLGL